MCAVLSIEIIKIWLMLEVVSLDLALICSKVWLNVIIVNNDVNVDA